MGERCAVVTGATGFIGNRLVLVLRERGWDVIAVSRRPVTPRDEGIAPIASGDLLRPDALQISTSSLVGRIDVFFHLAALMPTHQPPPTLRDYLVANAQATAGLLQTSADLRIPSFVYASSLTVIGKPEILPIAEDHPARPLIPYAFGKWCGELACEFYRRTEGRSITSLRIASPYGPGMPQHTVLPRFVRQAIASEDLLWYGSGRRTQNFVHVDDVVQALLLAAETRKPGVYNVAGPGSIDMQSLAQQIIRLTPESSRARPAGVPDPQDDFFWEVDHRNAEAGLGYRPRVSLERGTAELITMIRSGASVPRWWVEA